MQLINDGSDQRRMFHAGIYNALHDLRSLMISLTEMNVGTDYERRLCKGIGIFFETIRV